MTTNVNVNNTNDIFIVVLNGGEIGQLGNIFSSNLMTEAEKNGKRKNLNVFADRNIWVRASLKIQRLWLVPGLR